MPAKAGIQGLRFVTVERRWIPAFAGMTNRNVRRFLRSAARNLDSSSCSGRRIMILAAFAAFPAIHV
jgi:hypothetical protein